MASGATIGEKVFAVEGRGEFPFDMLRYDACWPETSSDAAALIGVDHPNRRRITLRSASKSAPTKARWESFLWRVI